MLKELRPGSMVSFLWPFSRRRLSQQAKDFSPGGTRFHRSRQKSRCLWRENSLMLHLLNCSVNPTLHLGPSLRNWHDISTGLRESPRASLHSTAHSTPEDSTFVLPISADKCNVLERAARPYCYEKKEEQRCKGKERHEPDEDTFNDHSRGRYV